MGISRTLLLGGCAAAFACVACVACSADGAASIPAPTAGADPHGPSASEPSAPGSVPAGDAAAPSAPAAEPSAPRPPGATSCAATADDEACFSCCEARFPSALDRYDAHFEACVGETCAAECATPSDACDECVDVHADACDAAAEKACASDPSCAGLAACEESSGCYEKPPAP